MIRLLAMRELRSMFAMPSTWFILAALQFIFAWFFLARLEAFLGIQPQLAQLANPPGVTNTVAAPMFNTVALLMMMLVPLFTMRLIAEERRNQTLALLLSAPLSDLHIVLGKFLGLLVFLAVLMSGVVLMLYSLAIGTNLDNGLLLSNILGLLLLTASYIALGLYVSALTAQPVIAAIGALAVLLGLWLADIGAAAEDSQGSRVPQPAVRGCFNQRCNRPGLSLHAPPRAARCHLQHHQQPGTRQYRGPKTDGRPGEYHRVCHRTGCAPGRRAQDHSRFPVALSALQARYQSGLRRPFKRNRKSPRRTNSLQRRNGDRVRRTQRTPHQDQRTDRHRHFAAPGAYPRSNRDVSGRARRTQTGRHRQLRPRFVVRRQAQTKRFSSRQPQSGVGAGCAEQCQRAGDHPAAGRCDARRGGQAAALCRPRRQSALAG